MAMVEVGGKITKTQPLTKEQNGICALIGSGELLWGLFLKCLPLGWFQFKFLQFDEKPMTQEEEEKSIKGKLKSSSSVYKADRKKVKDVLDKGIKDNYAKAK
jgi:hypothetical protein